MHRSIRTRISATAISCRISGELLRLSRIYSLPARPKKLFDDFSSVPKLQLGNAFVREGPRFDSAATIGSAATLKRPREAQLRWQVHPQAGAWERGIDCGAGQVSCLS